MPEARDPSHRPTLAATSSSTPAVTDPSGRVPLTLRKGIAIFGIGGVAFMTANLVPLMMIALSEQLSVSTTQAGTIMTASLLLTALTSLATARWAAGSQRTLIARIGLLVGFAGFGVAAIVPIAPLAIAGILIGGVGAGGGVSTAGAALAALRNPNRASGFSGLTNRVLVTIVLALIPMFGIIMQSAFGILALLSLAAFFTVQWLPTATVKDQVDLIAPVTDGPGAPTATAATAVTATTATTATTAVAAQRTSDRRVRIAGFTLLVCFALWAVGEDSLWAMAGAMGADQAGFTEQNLGLVLSASTAGGLVAAVALIFIGAKGGRALPLAIMLVLGGALKIWAAFATDPALYAGIIIAWNTIYSIAFMYIVATAAALDAAGRWSGPLFGTYLVGSSFAPVVGATLADLFGYNALGIILGCISFALILPLVSIARLSSRIEKSQPPVGELSPELTVLSSSTV
jgi:DHA1 family inner membrane transport protein